MSDGCGEGDRFLNVGVRVCAFEAEGVRILLVSMLVYTLGSSTYVRILCFLNLPRTSCILLDPQP